ncbi:MAG: iron ABC transporter permease [Synergistaceae bacterium]|jgi:iron complex transport system permease protein|nr:iron ABC transporter permease [Synergistaceae bacterium]
MKRYRVVIFFAVSLIILLVCPWFGAQPIFPSSVWGSSGLESRIFWQLRLPRVILAWCAGATFGVCGMVFQAIFRNPLAEPSILGVSSGAALGAATAIRFGFGAGILGGAALQISAFAGALLSIGIISALSRLVKGTKDATLLLAGVAISSLFSSLIMVFQYTGGAVEAYSLLSWTMGGISVVGMNEGLRVIPSLLIVLALALFFSTELDLMLFGDEIASTRGVAIERTRRLLFVGISIAVAIVVSNCGPIAFLGLIAPHVARRIVGSRHKTLSIITALTGGSALVLCDTAARTVWAPADLPVGIIISFLGAPFFLWLLFGPKDN